MDFSLYICKGLVTKFPQHPWIFNTLLILSKIQLLSLSLIFTTSFIEDRTWTPIYMVSRLAKAFYFDFTTDSDTQLVIFTIVQSYTWFSLIFFLMMIFGFWYKLPFKSFLDTFWNFLCYFHVYFACYACFSFLADIISSFYNENIKFEVFLSERQDVVIGLSVVGIIWNIMLLTITLYLISSHIKVKGRFALKTSSILTVEALEKLILMSIFIVYENDQNGLVLILLNFFSSYGRIIYERRTFPYFNMLTNKICILFSGPNATICLVNLVGYAFRRVEKHDITFCLILWILSIPGSIKMSLNIFLFEVTESLAMNKYSSLWMILSRRTIMNYMRSKNLRKNESTDIEDFYKLYFKGVIKSASSKYYEKEYREFILESYETLMNKYPKFHQFAFTYIDLLLKYKSSPSKIYTLINMYEKKNLGIKSKVALYHLKEKLQNKIILDANLVKEKSEFDMNQYIWIQNHITELKEQIKSQIRIQTAFWREFSIQDTKFANLFKISKQVQYQKKTIQNLWRQYESFNIKDYYTPGIIYSVYLSFVCNQPRAGQKILSRYDKRISLVGNSKILSNSTLFQNNTMYILASCKKNSLGIIKQCSKSFEDYLGYTQRDLIGKNVDILMTPYFANFHQEKMKKFYETGKVIFSNKIQSVFFKSKSEFILEGNLFTTISPFIGEDDISMVTLIKIPQEQKKYILVRKDGVIDGFSEPLADLIKKAGNSITDLSPEFNGILSNLNGTSYSQVQLFTLRTVADLRSISSSPRESKKNIYENGLNLYLNSHDCLKKSKYNLHFSTIAINDDKLHVMSVEEKRDDEMEIKSKKFITWNDEDSADNLFEIIGFENQPLEKRPSEQKLDFQRKFIAKETEMEELINERNETNEIIRTANTKRYTEFTEPDKNVSYLVNFSPQENKLEEDKSHNIFKRGHLKSSSLGSNSSKSRTERILEKGLSYYLIKKKYIFFKWALVSLVIVIMILMFITGTEVIDSQQYLKTVSDLINFTSDRIDGMLILMYNLRQIEFISSGALGLNTQSTYDLYISSANESWPYLFIPNQNLTLSLKKIDDDLQRLFYEPMKFYSIDLNSSLNNLDFKMMDTFQGVEEMVIITRDIIGRSKFGLQPPDKRIPYLQFNLMNHILTKNLANLEVLKAYADLNMENTKQYVKTTSGIGIAMIITVFLMIIAVYSFLNQDVEEFSKALSKIPEQLSIGMIKLLQALLSANEEEMRRGCRKVEKLHDEIDKDKKEQKVKSYYTKNISNSESYYQNFFLILKICPMVIIIFITILVLLLVSLDSLNSVIQYQNQIEISLDLIIISDAALYTTVEAILHPEATYGNKPIYDQAITNNHLATQTDYWTAKIDSSLQSNGIIQSILYGLNCNDTRLGASAIQVELCKQLSGDANNIGLLQIMSFLSQESSRMLDLFYFPVQTTANKANAMNFLYTNYEKINFYENLFLVLMKNTALDLMNNEIENQKSKINSALTGVLISTVVLLVLMYFTILKQIINQGNEIKSMFGFFPYTLIMRTRSLKDYLVRNSGKLGKNIRNLS